MKEQLIDFDRYIISEDGNIYSKWFNKNLERKPSNDGYVRVTLKCKDGKKRHYLKHRVIAYYFIPNPEKKPEIDHINTIKTDNRVENLRWVTSSENSKNKITLQKNIASQPKNKIYAYIDNKLIGVWESENAAARELNINQGNIHNCATGKCKTYKGYKWSYKSL